MKYGYISLIAIALLSGCAYQQAVLSDKAEEQHTASEQATTITPPAQPQIAPQPSATSTAHKMIAPITSF